MASVIDMQSMRYINLFSRTCGVSTKNCFSYNNQLVFVVPAPKVSKAIGKGAANVRRLREILRRNIKVVAMPNAENKESLKKFIEDVVDPVEFTKIDVSGNVMTITAGRQNKAALIGRNRIREKELSDVLKNYFGIAKVRIA